MSHQDAIYEVHWRRGSDYRWVKISQTTRFTAAAAGAVEWLADLGGQVRINPRPTDRSQQ